MTSTNQDGRANNNGSSPTLQAAIEYALRGWKVFPVAPVGKGVGRRDGKEPFPGTQGFKDASSDRAQLEAEWKKHPNANIGLACSASNLVVLDVDLDLDIEDDAARWERFRSEYKLPDTFNQRTPGGGLHLVYSAVPGVKYPGKVEDDEGRIADIKFNGYIVLAPSVARSGRRAEPAPYEVVDHRKPVPAPAWLADRKSAVGSDDAPGDGNDQLSDLKVSVREQRRKEGDTRLLELLRAKKNTLASREDWLKLGLAIHAGYTGTPWETEAEAAWLNFSEKWEAPRGTMDADFYGNAARVWRDAKEGMDGGVMPATAQMILSKLPALPPADVRPTKVKRASSEPDRVSDAEFELTGLAGCIAELVTLANDRKLRVFPAAAALMAMSALASPRFLIRGPQGLTPLCLYGLLLGGTGSGKEACRKASDLVLTAAGRRDEMLDGIASDKALHRALTEGGEPHGNSNNSDHTRSVSSMAH